MTDSTNSNLRRFRTGLVGAPAVIAAIALSCLAAPAAAAGNGTPQTASGNGPSRALSQTSNLQKALAFARCMRSHGVGDFPDPNSSGIFPKRQVARLAATDPQFVPAHRACEHLLPNAGQPNQAQVTQAWNDMRRFAQCMRSHGVANWPDPTVTSRQDSRPFFNTPSSIDTNAPQILAKVRACQHLLHAGNPLDTTQ